MLAAILLLCLQASSVEPSKAHDLSSTWTSRGGVLDMRNVTLRTAIAAAYGVEERDVYGPASIDADRYDIVVKAGAVEPHAEMARRLRAVLASRFHLEEHAEDRERPGFALTIGAGGLKLKPVDAGEGPRTNATNGRFEAQRAPMGRIVQSLGRLLEVPIVDATGLTGAFSFTIEWSTDEGALDRALAATAGLRLEKRKVPVASIVVDRVEQ